MKRICAVIAFAILFCAVFPPLASGAAEEKRYVYDVVSVNSYPKTNGINVYTSEYGAVFSAGGKYSVYSVAVSADRAVVGVSEEDTVDIPQGGFIAVARGAGNIKKLRALELSAGDRVLYDESSAQIIFMAKGYSPFYQNVIHFDKFNSTRTENTIVIYDRGVSTGTNIWGTEAVVGENGLVVSVGGNNNAIPQGGFVISAVGRERIAELSAAAEEGLAVTVDRDAKTVTFSFGKDSLLAGMKVLSDNIDALASKRKLECAVFDTEAYETGRRELDTFYAAARDAGDDEAAAMLAFYDFKHACGSLTSVLNEYPAVEERALWLRPSESSTREQVNQKVKKIYEAGFNAVCVELLFNSVTIFPVDTEEYLFSQDPSLKGFDVLAAYIDECHRYGIEVFGWMVCYRVSHGSTTYPQLALTTKKPEWLNMAKSGTSAVGESKGYFLNPALPEVSEHLLKFYKYILETYDLDGFQLDYIRYPLAEGEDFGYDAYTRSLFKEKYGKDPMDFGKSDPLWNDWCRFRASFVTEFVKKVKALVDEIRPDVYLAADVAPNFNEVYTKYMQESKIWLENGHIDIAFPMVYGTNIVPEYSKMTVSAAGDHAYSYIGLTDYGADVLDRQIREVREAGGDGFAFFAYAEYFGTDCKNVSGGLLSKRSLSPTFDPDAALAAQLEYLKKRLDIIEADKLPEPVREAVSAALNAEYVHAEDAYAALVQSAKTLSDQAVAADSVFASEMYAVLASDIAKAAKIARLSKAAAKAEYRKSHPFPVFDESEPEESAEPQSETEHSAPAAPSAEEISPENSSGGVVLPVIIAALAVCALAVCAVIFIRRKKK